MEHSSLQHSCVYSQIGRPLQKSQMSSREECSIAYILPSRLQDGAESLGIETVYFTSVLVNGLTTMFIDFTGNCHNRTFEE